MTEIEKYLGIDRVRVYLKTGKSKSFANVSEVDLNDPYTEKKYMIIRASLADGYKETIRIPYENIDYFTFDTSPETQTKNQVYLPENLSSKKPRMEDLNKEDLEKPVKILFVDVHETKDIKCYLLDTLAKPYRANPYTTHIKNGLTPEELILEVNKLKEDLKADRVIYNISPGISGTHFKKVLFNI